MNEATVQAGIFRDCGALPDMRLFRNNVGGAWAGVVVRQPDRKVMVLRNYRWIDYGLVNGSCDLIGWRSIRVEQRHVGQRLGVLTGMECKDGLEQPSTDQARFLHNAGEAGCLVGVVRNSADALAMYRRL